MNTDFNLTPSQKQAWQTLLDESTSRGSKTAMAKEIAKLEKKADPASWKTTVSGFFKGNEKELRAVFGHQRRLRAAESGLGIEPGLLRAWLQQVQGGATQDGPLDIRIAGFEDYGPVPVVEGYFAPPVGPSKIWLPPKVPGEGTAPSAMTGGALKLEDIVTYALPRTPPQTFAIVFCSEPGFGKTTLLKMLTARLQQAGAAVTSWQPGVTPTGGVLVCDDLALLDPGQRTLLCKTVASSSCVLLTATSAQDPLTDLPPYRAVYSLEPGYEQWSIEYLTHLEQLLVRRWGREVSLAPLKQWIESDLFGPDLANRLDNLGLLARHVVDGGTLPPRYRDLAPKAVAHAASQLRRRGYTAAALLVEEYGEQALQHVMKEACLGSGFDVAMRTLLKALRIAAEDSPRQHSSSEAEEDRSSVVFEAAEQLCQSALFHKRGDRVFPTQPACAISALGAALVQGGQVDSSLLERVILAPHWTDSLVSAAEQLGDGSAVLSALLALPPSALCQAIPAITRMLSADVPFSDAETYRRAFLPCLSIWARWPADQRAKTLMLGGPMNAAPPALNHERLVNGHAPLLALARASLRHRKLLPNHIALEDIQQGKHLPAALRDYLTLLGTPEPSLAEARDAVGLGAPYQSQVLLDPEFWLRLPPHDDSVGQMPAGFKSEDYSAWWRSFGAPRLLELPDGEARVAGTHPDHKILTAKWQNLAGCELWKNALISQIKKRHPLSAQTFAEITVYTVDSGGRWNADTVRAVWDAVSAEREVLRQAVYERLLGLEDVPHSSALLLPWLLTVVVVDQEREALWLKWSAAAPAQVPWKLFLDGGVSVPAVSRWALETLQQIRKAREEGSQAWDADAKLENARAALKEIISRGDVAILEQIIRSGDADFSGLALTHLCTLSSAAARQLRIELAGQSNAHFRNKLLAKLIPAASEAQLWRQHVAAREMSPYAALACWACYDLVAESAIPWAESLACLEVLDALVAHRAEGEQLFVAWCNRLEFRHPDLAGYWQQLQQMPADSIHSSLLNMAAITSIAEQAGTISTRPLVEAIMFKPALRRNVLGGNYIPLWLSALRHFGNDQVISYLVEDHEILSPHHGTQLRLQAFTPEAHVELLRSLLQHPILAESAAAVLAANSYRNQQARLSAALDSLPSYFVSKPQPDWHPIAVPLLLEYVRCAPEASMDWLKVKLAGSSKTLRRALWSKLVPRFSAGQSRARALTEYFSTTRQK